MIDARRLGTLATLDRVGTVAAVASELHLTPSGVSMQLAALERELGLRLTERRGRRVALTPAGKLLAVHGARVLDQLTLASQELDGLRRGVSGSYRVAAFPSAARTIVARAWREMDRRSAIELTLATPEPEEAVRSLVSGETDIAVLHSYSNVPRDVPASIETVAIAEEPVHLAIRAADPLAQGTVALHELAERSWITAPEGLTCRLMTERACGLAGFRPRVVARTLDFGVQAELVASSMGVALVPLLAVGELPSNVKLAPVDPPIRRHIFAAWRTGSSKDPGVAQVVAVLRESAAVELDSVHGR